MQCGWDLEADSAREGADSTQRDEWEIQFPSDELFAALPPQESWHSNFIDQESTDGQAGSCEMLNISTSDYGSNMVSGLGNGGFAEI
mmetsp:Transcript_46777/g.93702  ORF Transcript_46777/g.93702 Transcript_46777/m.93702 type:complete len:87 (+) Transcript_46777:394-654(+)